MSIYEGNESYIFISYSHKDNKKVMPVIKRLQKDGYRVWYDDGIEVGSEWPETVANHLLSCELFLVFVSNSYLDSFNCKREIDFSVSKRKSTIAVILEETNMSPGTEMQLSSVQFLNKYLLKDEEFYSKLYQSELMHPCHKESEKILSDEELDSKATEDRSDSNKQLKKYLNFFGKKLGNTVATLKKRKINLKKLSAIVGIILIVAAFLFVLVWNFDHVTIAGVKYTLDTERLTIKDTTLTNSDTKKLSRFNNLSLIEFENCDFSDDSEDSLSRIKNGITSFHLIDCKGLDNFNWLGSLESVKWLEINNSGFKDAYLSNIWFFNMERLISIDLSNNKEFTNLGGVMKRIGSDLQNVRLANTGVHNISSLNKFENLDMIDISGCEVSSLEPLKNLKNITYIVADDNKLEDLNGIEELTNLNRLSASGNNIESMEPIRDCMHLESVDLSNNKIEDVTPLVKSSMSLKKLSLSNNNINDMTPLSGMGNLEALLIDGNNIENLDFLNDSSDLEILSARNNKITSIESVLNKEDLDALYLSDNMITGDVVFGENLGIWNDSNMENFGPWDIQLHHNRIKSIEFKGKVPKRLSVYDNPLDSLIGPLDVEEVETEESEKGTATFTNSEGHTVVVEDFDESKLFGRIGTMSGVNNVYLSWNSESDKMIDILYSLDKYTNLYLSECPLDCKSQAEEMIPFINYVDNEKMDEIMDAERADYLNMLTF